MVKRRTLGEGLTPEEKAFLQGPAKTPKSTTKPKPPEEEEKPIMRENTLRSDFRSPPPIVSTAVAFADRMGTVGLNTRVEPGVREAMLRAFMERKIQRKAGASIQDIVNEALTDWLKKNGYWD